MLEAAGGGGGGTPWELMSVETMHELIHSADTSKQWDIVGGWQKSAELLNEHRFQVQDYRDNLASAWPPKSSAAASAYLERLDQLIANLKETYEATLANHDALSAATGSIYQAQSQMDKIYQEYTKNNDLLKQQTATQQSNTATPMPSPSPSGDEPLVAPGRQEELRQQAVTLMSSVSTDLAQAQVRIVTPPRYTTINPIGDKSTPNEGSPYTPPPIPAIVPVSSDGSSTAKSSRPTIAFPNSTSPVTTAPITAQPGVGSHPGLVLGGTTPTVVTPPPTSVTTTLPAGGSGPISPSGFPNTFVPSTGSSVLSPIGPGGRSIGLTPGDTSRLGAQLPEGVRAMPPGGVIGGTPGTGMGRSDMGRVGARRINPFGGVIGGGEGAHGATMNAGAGQPYGQAGGRRSGRHDDSGGTHWDPDNPWETEEGVDPVVLPPRERRIDPGPAIGLG